MNRSDLIRLLVAFRGEGTALAVSLLEDKEAWVQIDAPKVLVSEILAHEVEVSGDGVKSVPWYRQLAQYEGALVQYFIMNLDLESETVWAIIYVVDSEVVAVRTYRQVPGYGPEMF